MQGKTIDLKNLDSDAQKAVKVAEAHTGFQPSQLKEVKLRGERKYLTIFQDGTFHSWYNVDIEGNEEEEVSYLIESVPHVG